jgi:hypothetical protein
MKRTAIIMVMVFLAAAMLTACSSGGSSGSAPGSSGATTPVISAKGGEGTVANGGSGGAFEVIPYDNTSVKIDREGTVNTAIDTAFFDNLIASTNLDFGAVLLDVTNNLTISTYPSGTETGVADGEYHMHASDSTLYKRNSGVDDQVTGIHVRPGKTLTLGLNWSNNPTCPVGCESGYDVAAVMMSDDIWNEGTITTLDLVTGKDDILGSVTNIADGSVLDKGSLDLRTSKTILNDGTIITRGTDTTVATGGWGGSIYLWADTAIVNRGTIDSSGGTGLDGGKAAIIELHGVAGIWNAGPLTTKGGTGTENEGGHGARIVFNTYGWQSLLYNSGTLNSSGGDGPGGGGSASGSTLYAGVEWDYACGAFVNSGNLIANGGIATTDGNGGTGANYWAGGDAPHVLGAFGCNLLNSGTIEMKGGAGKGSGNSGGDGGELYVWTAMDYDYYDNVIGPGSILFGGSLAADGGSGETGGSGGYVQLGNYAYLSIPNVSNGDDIYPTMSGSIEVLGYSAANFTGGKGALDGGSGGYATLYWSVSNTYDPNVNDNTGNGFIVTPSSIYTDVDFDLSGGQGVAGNGGTGGAFYAQMHSDYIFWEYYKPGAKSAPAAPGSIENHGKITTKGGQGALSGGDAGYRYDGYYDADMSIYMLASGNIINTGILDASGGAATDTAGNGGYGNPVRFDALGNVLNSGSITVSGGYGADSGGDGAWVDLVSYAGTNFNSAAVTANGGNASATAGSGGNGGYIYIANYYGPLAASSTGTLSVTGGTAANPGSDGGTYVGYD